MRQHHAVPEPLEPNARPLQSLAIPVTTEEPRPGLTVEKGRCVAGVAQRGIEVETWPVRKEREGLFEKNGLMT
jgi:hypothetical protein